ncbi:glycosyltransferase [Chitinophaga niabensis]|uniref:Rhamnosyl/mannosyltransferase n=1 Tax=Chitinophaga niabensis TaxID=536979 RepID=A0A1N6JXI4_9BACT|nr:glycosyltransferase [Chitinophaga niabensis]SIO49048.1 rhamnosyl/mannosyltransferase [Chitinophaga niabensis]
MTVTHIIKYLYPVFGGMERVAEQIGDALKQEDIREYKIFYKRDKNSDTKWENTDADSTVIDPTFYYKAQPISLFRGSVALWKKFKAADVTIIHSPLPNLEVPLYFFSFLIKRRIICVMHADPKDTRWEHAKGVLNFFYKQFFKRCETVVFTNELNARQTVIPCKNKVVINNGVKITAHPPRIFPEKTIYEALFVGSFREYKGLRYLIDALSFNSNIRINFVGSGEIFEEIKEYAHSKYDPSRTVFYGHVTDEELADIYNRCDVFVLPSIDGSEAFGLVQIEAMSRGLPVINTNLDTAVKYVSKHGETGITVEPMKSEEIAMALKEILQKENYELFSRNAISRATMFSSEKMMTQYISLIKKEGE